jgi:hypothetical protein
MAGKSEARRKRRMTGMVCLGLILGIGASQGTFLPGSVCAGILLTAQAAQETGETDLADPASKAELAGAGDPASEAELLRAGDPASRADLAAGREAALRRIRPASAPVILRSDMGNKIQYPEAGGPGTGRLAGGGILSLVLAASLLRTRTHRKNG